MGYVPARVVLEEHVAQVLDGTGEELILGLFSSPWPSLAAPEYMGDDRGRPRVENAHLAIYSVDQRKTPPKSNITQPSKQN